MPIKIHGKPYYTVAERVQEAHKDNPEKLDINTEIIAVSPSKEHDRFIVKATVLTKKGTFTGFAEETRGQGMISGKSPLEVAETSAIGRALGFAGYGSVESIATADEVISKSRKPESKEDAKKAFFPEGGK